MGLVKGRVREIRLGPSGNIEISIACPAVMIPHAGQYLLGSDPQNYQTVLGTPLFDISNSSHGFWAAPLHPVPWSPGTILDLVGPLGHGFSVPDHTQRLGLVALGETMSRLMPLVHQAANTPWGMTLFTNLTLPVLPAALEVYPLATLPEALDWPDYLVLDVPLEQLVDLRQTLGLADRTLLPCPAEVLVTTPLPCAGLARCGACSIHTVRGWKLACEDGPVFNLKGLQW